MRQPQLTTRPPTRLHAYWTLAEVAPNQHDVSTLTGLINAIRALAGILVNSESFRETQDNS